MPRNRPSSIDRLPDDIREQLQALLRDPRVTQMQATEQINQILAAEGHDDRVSKSAVNRYAVEMQEVGQKLRQSREIADMWISKVGAAPQGQLGHLVNEMLRTLSFELILKLQDSELTAETIPEVIDQLKQLSLATTRLERASTENVKRERDIKRAALAEAAEAAGEEAARGGLTDDTIQTIRQRIMGIA